MYYIRKPTYFLSQVSFDHLVKRVLKKTYTVSSSSTCYMHLLCTRDGITRCLDWREVCDGKVDCWPTPVDEQNCEILEENECAANEFRCLNGQCIPELFLFDNVYSPDCLDRSDEDLLQSTMYPQNCFQGDPAFRCTDITFSHWVWSLDGCCEPNSKCGTDSCRKNTNEAFERNILSYAANSHITKQCWTLMICSLQLQYQVSFVSIR